MWHNRSNNNDDYYREDRERERAQWRSQTPMESFGKVTSYQSPPYSQHREDEGYEWNHQHRYEPSNEEMSYGWNHDYQYEQMEYGWNPQYQQEPSNEEMEYEWSNEHQYYPSNEEMNYVEEYRYQQESFDPNLCCHDGYQPEYIEDGRDNYGNTSVSSSAQSQEDEVKAILDRLTAYMRRHDNPIAPYWDSLNAEDEVEEVSDNEDMVQENGVWNVFPEECDEVDEHQEDRTQQSLLEEEEEITQFQEDELTEDVQDAQFPLQEEIEEVLKEKDMTPEGEVTDVFHMAFEIVVEHQDDPIFAQQQSPAGEEVKEIIQLHEDALDEDALTSLVAVVNEKTLRYNNASTNWTNKEEDEVFQLYELPQKELRQDEAVEQEVLGSPTPSLEYPQGPRKKLEWRIKHKWKEKLYNV